MPKGTKGRPNKSPEGVKPKKGRGRPSNAEKVQQAAVMELERRKRASEDIIEFAKYINPDFVVPPHIRMLGDILNDIANGNKRHILLSMCPRSGKSYMVSELFPAFYLGRNTKKKMITTSCTAELATDFSRKVRNLIQSEEFKRIFPDSPISLDSRRADRFYMKDGGGVHSAGVGGLITGFGGNVLISDDAIKDRQDALSETIMGSLWSWYRSAFSTRALPGNTSIIVVQTRWSEIDLIARLKELSDQGLGEKFEVINIPALDKDGESYWPEWWSKEDMHRRRQTLGETEFQALYMGNPTPAEGVFFKRDDIQITDDYPEGVYYISSDLAASKDGDKTVHTVGCLTKGGQLVIVDGWVGKAEPDVWIKKLVGLVKKYKPRRLLQEKGPIWRSVCNYLTASLRDAGVFSKFEEMSCHGKKEEKAQAMQGAFVDGKCVLYDTPFCHELLEELVTFPNGKYDDMTDSAGMLVRELGDKLYKHYQRTPKKKSKMDAYSSVRGSFLESLNRWKTQ